MMITGERLKQLRSEKKWTLEELASKVNKHKSTLSSIESGKARAGGALLEELAKLYNVTTDYLLGLSNHRTLDGEQSSSVDEELQELLANAKKLSKERRDLIMTMARSLVEAENEKEKGDQ